MAIHPRRTVHRRNREFVTGDETNKNRMFAGLFISSRVARNSLEFTDINMGLLRGKTVLWTFFKVSKGKASGEDHLAWWSPKRYQKHTRRSAQHRQTAAKFRPKLSFTCCYWCHLLLGPLDRLLMTNNTFNTTRERLLMRSLAPGNFPLPHCLSASWYRCAMSLSRALAGVSECGSM